MSLRQNNCNSNPDGTAAHKPVMIDAVLDVLEPVLEGRIVDGTFGAGGYSGALLEAGAKVIGIDRDQNVLQFVKPLEEKFGDSFSFVPGRFSVLDQLVKTKTDAPIDGVVLDIGVSSMQLDQAQRGFSFLRDGPLDMRMGQSEVSAADLVNEASERDLSDLLFTYGEEKRARRIAKAIIEKRRETPFQTTLELANLIEETVGRKPGGNHPATKSFQALRIAVNQEMNELVEGLFAAERVLRAGGWLVVVTFHSLEDRIVKRFFDVKKSAGTISRHMPQSQETQSVWECLSKPLRASSQELLDNPRARSATLRCGRRTSQAARVVNFEGLGVPGYKLFGNKIAGTA